MLNSAKKSGASADHGFFRLLAFVAIIVTAIFVFRYGQRIAEGEQEFAPDFRVFYHASEFVKHGDALYFDKAQKELLARDAPLNVDYPYVYPPYSALFFSPLALFSFEVGKYIFLAFQLLVYVLVLRSSSVRALWPAYMQRDHYTLSLLALSSPFIVNTMLTGQLGIFFAAVMLLGFSLLEKAPVKAGMVLSLLMIKPTLALAVPVYLIIARQKKALAWFILCTSFYTLCSLMVWGVSLWEDWLQSSKFLASVFAMPQLPDNFISQMTGIYTAVRMLGGGTVLASLIQSFTALTAVLALVISIRQKADKYIIFSLLIISPLIMNAYVWQYDAVVAIIAVIMLLEKGIYRPFSLPARLVMIMVIFSPLAVLQLQVLGIPYGALSAVGLFLVISHEMQKKPAL